MAISIHAPTKGATIALIMDSPSRSISIHAPTKGATLYRMAWCPTSANFNPRSHEGSDNGSSVLSYQLKRFQSTLPRRERPVLIGKFNNIQRISIHAPTKGATRFINASFNISFNFNPRSHEGSDSNFIQKSFYILDKINKLTLFHAIFPFFVLLLFS